MENEEEEVDFEVLSKQYPLFFSSSKSLIKEKYYPSTKSPKPISDSPQIYLDYDDYMLDERVSSLQPYPIENKSNTSNKHHSTDSSHSHTETALSPSALKNSNSSNKSSISTKIKSDNNYNSISNFANQSPNLNHESAILSHGLNHNIGESKNIFQDFKETGVQAPKKIIKRRINTQPPPPSQAPLHSGYPLLFDYQPIHPQRQQKLQSGTEKIFYKNGDILVHYVSGKEKIYHQNIILTKYKNGDILQEFLDGATAYRYGNTGTIELTLPDRTSIIQYPNGQREKRTPEGETIVKFSDGVFMKVDAEGKWTMVKSKT